MKTSKLSLYFSALTDPQKEEYAVTSLGSTVEYFRKRYLNKDKSKRMVPRPDRIELMWKSTNGKLSRQDILDHFY